MHFLRKSCVCVAKSFDSVERVLGNWYNGSSASFSCICFRMLEFGFLPLHDSQSYKAMGQTSALISLVFVSLLTDLVFLIFSSLIIVFAYYECYLVPILDKPFIWLRLCTRCIQFLYVLLCTRSWRSSTDIVVCNVICIAEVLDQIS